MYIPIPLFSCIIHYMSTLLQSCFHYRMLCHVQAALRADFEPQEKGGAGGIGSVEPQKACYFWSMNVYQLLDAVGNWNETKHNIIYYYIIINNNNDNNNNNYIYIY